MMTHHEIVQAILDGKSLDMRDKQDRDAAWQGFCTDGASVMPLLKVLETLVMHYTHKNCEFRIRPTTVTKCYGYRAYVVDENRVYYWTSSRGMSQSEVLESYEGQVRWIEETQYNTYEVTL
jgi:hypothetical protein